MALKNRDNNVNYLRVRDGKFFIGKDTTTPYSELEGLITEMRYKDEEYEGTPQRKLIIVIEDDERYQLGINVESSTYSSLVSFLANVDVSKRLTLHPKQDTINKDGKDVTRRSMLVSQEGKFAKSYFTKDDNHGLPAWETVKVGNKKVTDKSAYLAFLEEFVTKTFFDKLSEAPEPTEKPVKAKAVTQDEDDDVSTSEDDLPWND